MNQIKLLSAAALMGSVTLFSSCLDTENKSLGVDVDGYFSTEEGLNAAKAQAYYGLQALAVNYNINCAGTDLYLPVRGKDAGDYQRYSLTPEDDEIASFYSNCYSLIKYGYFYAEKSGEGTKGEAEGHFLADYAYYLLTQQVGAVPYIDHYVSDANRNYPRASVDSIYIAVENDLENVYNNGGLAETDHEGKASKQAVAFLLAKVYLAHAWDSDTQLGDAVKGTYTVTGTSRFSKAAEWAIKAINGQQLTQTFEQKWSPSNEGNAEQIFSVQYERTGYPGDIDNGGHTLQSLFGNYYGDMTKTGIKYSASNGGQSEKSLYLFEKGDERYDGTFMTTIYNWDGTTGDNWSQTGYYAYYNNASKDNLPIVYQFFPYYVTTSEAEAIFKANPERYAVGSNANKSVVAYILSSPATQYTFASNGKSWTKKTVSFNDLTGHLGGGVVGGGTTVKKFDDPSSQLINNKPIDYRDVVLFDLSDAYLTAAEAYLLAGNQSQAITYVNAVRSRAKAETLNNFSAYSPSYTTSSSFGNVTALDVILDERARELYGQQVRWVDLRRTKQLVRYNVEFNPFISSVADMQGIDGSIKWLRPVPSAAINGNDALSTADQNPGY